MIKNYLSHFLPVLLALDLIIPFLLAPFYKDYNHLTQVMSVLGNSKAPLHLIYNIWVGGADMDYMTLKEASEKWGVSSRQVNYYCVEAYPRRCENGRCLAAPQGNSQTRR